MNNAPSVETLKPIIKIELETWHRGRERRAEKWALVEKVCQVSIPEDERNNNNPFERRVREAMSELRKEHVLICSDTKGGYWVADCLEDVLAVAEDLRKRARDLLVSARELRAEAKREFGGQLRLI